MEGLGFVFCEEPPALLGTKSCPNGLLGSKSPSKRLLSLDSHHSWTILSLDAGPGATSDSKCPMSERTCGSSSCDGSSSTEWSESSEEGNCAFHKDVVGDGDDADDVGDDAQCEDASEGAYSSREWNVHKNTLFTPRSVAEQISCDQVESRSAVIQPSRIPKVSRLPSCPGTERRTAMKRLRETRILGQNVHGEAKSMIPGPPKSFVGTGSWSDMDQDTVRVVHVSQDSIDYLDMDYFQFMGISCGDMGNRDDDDDSFSEDSFDLESSCASSTWTTSSVVDLIDVKLLELDALEFFHQSLEDKGEYVRPAMTTDTSCLRMGA